MFAVVCQTHTHTHTHTRARRIKTKKKMEFDFSFAPVVPVKQERQQQPTKKNDDVDMAVVGYGDDHLYEIRKRPTGDSEALDCLRMVLKQERDGRAPSITAKKNRKKIKAMRKKKIDPSVARLRRNLRSLELGAERLQAIKKSVLRKQNQRNGEPSNAAAAAAEKAALVRYLESTSKVMQRVIPVVDSYVKEHDKWSDELSKLKKESKESQEKFSALVSSVLAWGKNVIRWRPPQPWEFDRLPVTLYQLRIHSALDDPAAEFSTDKKKKAKARAKRKRVAAAAPPPRSGATKMVSIVPPRAIAKKQKTS